MLPDGFLFHQFDINITAGLFTVNFIGEPHTPSLAGLGLMISAYFNTKIRDTFLIMFVFIIANYFAFHQTSKWCLISRFLFMLCIIVLFCRENCCYHSFVDLPSSLVVPATFGNAWYMYDLKVTALNFIYDRRTLW